MLRGTGAEYVISVAKKKLSIDLFYYPKKMNKTTSLKNKLNYNAQNDATRGNARGRTTLCCAIRSPERRCIKRSQRVDGRKLDGV